MLFSGDVLFWGLLKYLSEICFDFSMVLEGKSEGFKVVLVVEKMLERSFCFAVQSYLHGGLRVDWEIFSRRIG